MRILIVTLILTAVAAAAGGWYWHAGSKSVMTYRTERVERGDLVSTISATGTLEPEEVVDVGAQVAGLILSFGTDAAGNRIDYRSPVKAEMVLAKIDDAVYRADVDTAKAQLAQANAEVQKSQADLLTANAKLFQAERNWNRAKAMGPSDALSQNDYDMYRAEYETAKANTAVVQAQIVQAQTGIALAQAALDKALRNLGFCTIKSPVNGVIIDRRVNIGQTVVSSLNAPSLFLIAKDLNRMQIWAAVNEADIGRINPGTPVEFTCDTFPGRTFKGSVGKVRLNATMTQNVVMYTVEINTDNPGQILLPYLTANVRFEVSKEPNVLMVPNAALRWEPLSAEEIVPDARSTWKPPPPPDAKTPDAGAGRRKRTEKHDAKSGGRSGKIWLREGELVRPVTVKVGSTNGLSTAVSSDALHEGQEVVVGEMTQTSEEAAKNPFVPQFRRR